MATTAQPQERRDHNFEAQRRDADHTLPKRRRSSKRFVDRRRVERKGRLVSLTPITLDLDFEVDGSEKTRTQGSGLVLASMQRESCGATVAGNRSSLPDTGTKRPEVARGIISATAAAQSLQRERDDRQNKTKQAPSRIEWRRVRSGSQKQLQCCSEPRSHLK
uniref:Uncharacterized protein n=1 Tax=Hyaloperonospora arabidopsidis (strain Emoy2) TaxID=559515 RepID=M4BC39_HYAAE